MNRRKRLLLNQVKKADFSNYQSRLKGMIGPISFTRNSREIGKDSDGNYKFYEINEPAFDADGMLDHPAIINKCQCYGLVPDDEEQAALTSGNMTVGKVYKIKAQESDTDFVADGATSGHAVGDTFVCTAATVTLTATKSVAEIKWAIGTKIYAGSTYNGFSLGSGGTNSYIEIVGNYGGLTAGIIENVQTSGKVWKIVYIDGGYLSVVATGLTGNTNKHSIGAVAASGTGNLLVKLDGGTGVTTSGSTYQYYTEGNITPASTAQKFYFHITSGNAFFALPGLYERTTAPRYPVAAASLAASTTCEATVWSVPGPGNIANGFQITMKVTPHLAGTDYATTGVRLFSTDDTTGTVDEVSTVGHATTYSYTHATGGGVFAVSQADLAKDTEATWLCSLKQEGSNVRAIIQKDGVEKLNTTTAGTLAHSDTSFLAGSWGTDYFEGSIKSVEVKRI